MKPRLIFPVSLLVSVAVNICGAATVHVAPGQSIQTAIDSASYGDTIQVAAGTYFETITLKKGITILAAGPSVTTIDGAADGSVVTSIGCAPNTVLEGFTITNGTGKFQQQYGRAYGGGMYCNASSPTVVNCTFIDNTAYKGGGLYNEESNPVIDNCTFTDNNATSSGGGMCNDKSSSPTITSCTFANNTAYRGAGMHNKDSNPTVVNCTFSINTTHSDGGGIYNHRSSPTITNCTFTKNTAGNMGGGGMANHFNSNPAVINCCEIQSEAQHFLSAPEHLIWCPIA